MEGVFATIMKRTRMGVALPCHCGWKLRWSWPRPPAAVRSRRDSFAVVLRQGTNPFHRSESLTRDWQERAPKSATRRIRWSP